MKYSIALLSVLSAAVIANPAMQKRGNFGPGDEAKYVQKCEEEAARRNIDADTAKTHCECATDAIKKNFSDEDIKHLLGEDGFDPTVVAKIEDAVFKACESG